MQGHVTVVMLNQLEDNNHTTYTISFTDTTDKDVIGKVTGRERAPSAWVGLLHLHSHTDLDYKPAKNCQYLKYDCLHFRIVKVELEVTASVLTRFAMKLRKSVEVKNF